MSENNIDTTMNDGHRNIASVANPYTRSSPDPLRGLPLVVPRYEKLIMNDTVT
jgi:hypothetical protein